MQKHLACYSKISTSWQSSSILQDQCGRIMSHRVIKWHVFPAALSPRQSQAVRIPLGNAAMADYTDSRDGIFLVRHWFGPVSQAAVQPVLLKHQEKVVSFTALWWQLWVSDALSKLLQEETLERQFWGQSNAVTSSGWLIYCQGLYTDRYIANADILAEIWDFLFSCMANNVFFFFF